MSYAKYGYIFALPFIIIFLIFTLYPTVYTFVLAFTDAHGVGNEIKFLDEPFGNFTKILTNKTFITCFKNTVKLWIMNFIPQITLAMLLTAWFTARRITVKGQGFFKVLFYMPNIITAATIAILFNALFGYPTGPVNEILTSLHIKPESFNFFVDKSASRLIVAFIQFWIWYGSTMIVLISGVLGISPDIYEAADIDGANKFQQIRHITIPSLIPMVTVMLLLSVGNLMHSDTGLFYQVTRNICQLYDATEVIDSYVLNSILNSGNFGYTAAASLFQSVVGLLLMLFANWMVRRIEPENALF
jgi:multiple sugar transport system permease protein